MLTLYHGRTSVCSVKARLALAEKSVAWDSKLMTLRGDQFDPEYMKLNPNAVVPTLVHDGKVIIESTVIMNYVDEAFPGPALAPAEPLARARMRMFEKLMDEYIHVSCMTLTFATANRIHLMKLSPQEMEAELAKVPDPKRAEIKRQVVTHGLDAPLVKDALRHHEKLFAMMETALESGPYLAGQEWTLADAAATPYIWRLDKLKLAPLWQDRRGIAAWFDRVRARPMFKPAVEDWVTPADHERYAKEPDPWPKVRDLLRAA
ncbi:MAG: glutathione S-transferase family protein [Xanthobacteraceae bacterium]